jgi:hypothetical protein
MKTALLKDHKIKKLRRNSDEKQMDDCFVFIN